MHNVNHRMDGDKLVITIDIGSAACQAAPLSNRGKSNLVATTSGFLGAKSPPGFEVAFSLNVTAKSKPSEQPDRRKVRQLYPSAKELMR